MSAASSRVPATLEVSPGELARRALPVRKRRELLTAIASAWRDAHRWPWSAVVLFLPVGRGAAIQFVPNKGWPSYYEGPLSPDDVPLSDKLREVCVAEFGADFGAEGVEFQPLGNTRHPTGALLTPVRIPETHAWLELSLKLLQQLEELESAQPNGTGVDWLHRRKMDALIEFAAGAGHEINNPVAAICGRVQLLLKDETDPAKRETYATIGAQALRISQMIGDAMQFAEPPPIHRERIPLASAVKRVLKKLSSRIAAQQFDVKVKLPRGLTLSADAAQLETLLAELLSNSLNALARGGKVLISAAAPATAENRFAVIEVRDNGPGLSEADRRHLFDPFYSGRQAGRGLGFGLCKCWRIAHQHGGSIAVRSVPWVETAFSVQWPISAE